ncbi:MAG: hypothetical protein Q614_SASC00148G0001, partial [Staphylococcus sp. DORA_6_22]
SLTQFGIKKASIIAHIKVGIPKVNQTVNNVKTNNPTPLPTLPW